MVNACCPVSPEDDTTIILTPLAEVTELSWAPAEMGSTFTDVFLSHPPLPASEVAGAVPTTVALPCG
ncbi:unnamed protein product, partial [Ixodes pacificus]